MALQKNESFFQICHKRVNSIYKRLCSNYTTVVTQSPFLLIFFYILLSCVSSFGLIFLNVDMDGEKLGIVRNSPSLRDAKILEETFGDNQYERHFNNKLLNLGCYFEVIVHKRVNSSNGYLDPENNMINKTVLNEWNSLFDGIMSISIVNDLNQTIKYDDVCARRLGKCSIDGGLFRSEKFQSKLLAKEVSIRENDVTSTYIDVLEQDGINFLLNFGKLVKFEPIKVKEGSGGAELFLVHAGVIRTRFDVLSVSDGKPKVMSARFMDAFIDYMKLIKLNYKHLEISYYTSHSFNTEMQYYSKQDALIVVGPVFLLFWLLFTICFLYSTSVNTASKRNNLFKVFCLIFSIMLQVILNLTSAFGVLSFLGIRPNLLTSSVVFIVTIVVGNQSYLIYFSSQLALKKISKDHCENYCALIIQSISERLLVPIFFSSIASIYAYSVIGLTSEFDSIYTYCLFANASLIFGLISQGTFYIPICYIVLKRNYKTLLTDDVLSSELSESEISSSPNKILKSFRSKYSRFSLYDTLFVSKGMQNFILAGFISYLIFNILIIGQKFTVDLPIIEFIPPQSFLREFLEKHQSLFDLGPIITVSFLKPLNYWEPEVYNSIQKLKTDALSLPFMNPRLFINWLDDLLSNSKDKSTYVQSCRLPLQLSCFKETFTDSVTKYPFYKDDAILNNQNDSYQITASRFFLSMQNFTGNIKERDLMHNLKHLINEHSSQLNLTSSDLIVYSPAFIYLEQLDELTYTFLSILIISIQSLTIISFFFLIDIRSIYLLFLVNFSIVLSTLGNLLLMGFTLNMVTLNQFLLFPSLLNEFFIYTSHTFLTSKTSKFVQTTINSENNSQKISLDNDSEKLDDGIKMKCPNRDNVPCNISAVLEDELTKNMRVVFNSYIIPSSSYIVKVVILTFIFFYFCTTFNFHSLFLFLMSFSFSLILHLLVFYPALLLRTGTI